MNTSLLRLELAANELQLANLDDEGEPSIQNLSLSPPFSKNIPEPNDSVLQGDDLPFTQIKSILADALARNHIFREATRHSAVQLLPAARILLHAKMPHISVTEIRSQVEADLEQPAWLASSETPNVTPSINYTYDSNLQKREAPNSTPLLRLPPELLTHVLRCYTALEAIPLPPNPSLANSYNPGQASTPIFASALSAAQFNRILILAQDRSTLSGMTHRFDTRMTGLKRDTRDQGRVSLHDAASFLKVVGCLEYERRRI